MSQLVLRISLEIEKYKILLVQIDQYICLVHNN